MTVILLALALAAPVSVPVTTLVKGQMSAIDEPRQAVVRDATEWAKLWKQHDWDAPPPSVDFSKHMVVGIFIGTRPTAGFAVEILKATLDAGTLTIHYAESRPPEGMITAQVLTMPFHLVSVPIHKGAVRFERVEAPHE
jgi:protease stability complex PrcB-like protein